MATPPADRPGSPAPGAFRPDLPRAPPRVHPLPAPALRDRMPDPRRYPRRRARRQVAGERGAAPHDPPDAARALPPLLLAPQHPGASPGDGERRGALARRRRHRHWAAPLAGRGRALRRASRCRHRRRRSVPRRRATRSAHRPSPREPRQRHPRSRARWARRRRRFTAGCGASRSIRTRFGST